MENPFPIILLREVDLIRKKNNKTAENDYIILLDDVEALKLQLISSKTIGLVTEISHDIVVMIDDYIDKHYFTLKTYSRKEITNFIINQKYGMSMTSLKQYLHLLDEKLSVKETTASVLESIVDHNLFITESAEVGAMDVGAITTISTSETFGDTGGEEMKSTYVGSLAPTSIGSSEQIDMAKFLSRPVPIYKTSWALGDNLSLNLPIWDLFTSNAAVRAKLRNFAYLRGDLHVRISVSGTPFHYSHILVSPQPFAYLNETLNQYLAGVALHTSLRKNLICYLSQAEGSCVMDIRENRPVDIDIPYMATKPVMRLFSNSTSVISGAFPDAQDMLNLFVYSINPLGATTTTATNIYIQIYAWMDNVELGTSTGTQMTIVTESNEMVTGPVQRIATRVADWTGALAKVPFLKPYASAANLIASGVSKVAAIFGWSRPVKVDDSLSVRNFPVNNSVISIGNSEARRIVIDPLQEVDVGGDALGVHDDQMIITNISSRMSYVDSFTWLDTDAPLVPLYTMRIHPNIVTSTSGGAQSIIQPTAMAFCVQPFEFWRGDIHVRLDVVCSAFHRGKFAVFYEPNCCQYALINANLSLNKQFLKIIDIQETQSVEFVVGWASYREWLKNMPALDAVTNTSQLNPTTFMEGYVNGYIGIVPFTELQSNNSVDPVYFNLYVMSPNLEVNGFTNINVPAYRYGYLESSTNFNAGSVLPLNLTSATHAHINERYFGEKIISFRSLLKRYVLTDRKVNTFDQTAGGGIEITTSIMPYIRQGYGFTRDDEKYEFTNLLSYLRYAYIGYKGSLRYILTYSQDGTVSSEDNSAVYVGFMPPSAVNLSMTATAVNGYTYNRPNNNGQSIEFIKTNNGIEFEMPFYSNNLFAFSFNHTNDDTLGAASMERTWYRNMYISLPNKSTGDYNTAIYLLTATGEDFNLIRFQGAPYYSTYS